MARVVVDVMLKPEILDPAGQATANALPTLGFDPVSLDALVARTGIAPSVLQARLLEHELAGLVARLPGGRGPRIWSRRGLFSTEPTVGNREKASRGGTEEAIRTDPRLSPEQRAALLGVYRSFVDPE